VSVEKVVFGNRFLLKNCFWKTSLGKRLCRRFLWPQIAFILAQICPSPLHPEHPLKAAVPFVQRPPGRVPLPRDRPRLPRDVPRRRGVSLSTRALVRRRRGHPAAVQAQTRGAPRVRKAAEEGKRDKRRVEAAAHVSTGREMGKCNLIIQS
jgi:hypothetical protein